jgi:hypothetical protein
LGKADLIVGGPIDERRGDRARLGQQRNLTGLRIHVGETGIQFRWRQQHTNRIGSDDA